MAIFLSSAPGRDAKSIIANGGIPRICTAAYKISQDGFLNWPTGIRRGWNRDIFFALTVFKE
jgi:hypothetical protein